MQALQRATAACARAARSGLMHRPASTVSPATSFAQVCARTSGAAARAPYICAAARLPRLRACCGCIARPPHGAVQAAAPPFVLLGQPACGLLVSNTWGRLDIALRARLDGDLPNNWLSLRRGCVLYVDIISTLERVCANTRTQLQQNFASSGSGFRPPPNPYRDA